MKYLLKKASKYYRDGQNPFNSDFLVKNNVTLDECLDLSCSIANAIDMYIISDKWAKIKSIFASMDGIPKEVLADVDLKIEFEKTIERLTKKEADKT